MTQYVPFLTAHVTGSCSVAVLCTVHGERPPAILRDVVALFAYFLKTVRATVIVVDYHVYGGS